MVANVLAQMLHLHKFCTAFHLRFGGFTKEGKSKIGRPFFFQNIPSLHAFEH